MNMMDIDLMDPIATPNYETGIFFIQPEFKQGHHSSSSSHQRESATASHLDILIKIMEENPWGNWSYDLVVQTTSHIIHCIFIFLIKKYDDILCIYRSLYELLHYL